MYLEPKGTMCKFSVNGKCAKKMGTCNGKKPQYACKFKVAK